MTGNFQASLKRGVKVVDIPVYTPENLLRLYKSTHYVILVAINLGLIGNVYFFFFQHFQKWAWSSFMSHLYHNFCTQTSHETA